MQPELLSEYFKKCFVAVDGLWFVMVEKADSFDKALDMDRKVWEVLPKIQARKIKELLEMEGDREEDLAEAVKFKLDAEDFVSELSRQERRMKITITQCPWLALLRKSKREHLAEKISDAICSVEYGVFAEEFLGPVNFEILSRLCSGDKACCFLITPH